MKINDLRNMPLNQCFSFGDLMATIEKCKRLDKKDKKREMKKHVRKID